jgi:rhodanese-related sulfurtransferase
MCSKAPCACKQQIKTDEVAKLITEKPGTYTLLDARYGKYYDGKVIPTAKHLGADSTESAISAQLPDKKAEIITYCAGVKCPASKELADKLHKMGYTNVKEYTEGLEGWTGAGKSTVELK